MKLECFALTDEPPRLIPARATREWMDAFPSRHAYRCLPLAIANAHGWEILSPAAFSIQWNGGEEAKDITFVVKDDFPWLEHFAMSNFTHGIVTFHTGYLFRTPPGWNLYASGPVNEPKDGIAPLTGVIETDWLPYPFTMNWQLTRPGEVTFQKDEPFCFVFPVPQNLVTDVTPEIHELSEDPVLKDQYEAWRTRRQDFMAKFKAGDEETLRQAWQRFYFRGELPSTGEIVDRHVNKLRVDAPVDRRKKDNGEA